jgi:7,8-dihydropterin-6-yl-methyl-4-(beta-D-ribofuranosyl)aminobenzene 5'-phosphate synthase
VCTDHPHEHAGVPHRVVRYEPGQTVREPVPLVPVDAVTITTLADAVTDLTLFDAGPAKRPGIGVVHRRPADLFEGAETIDWPLAESGFSTLLTVTFGGHDHRILFDAGISPDGVVENMRRLDLDPGDVEVIVLSHGHFDHTAGLEGVVRRLGRTNLPIVLHPAFWSRRRIAVPGREPTELPTTSRRALEGAGFEVVEAEQPSILFEEAVLVTGEVDRTTPYESGFAFHERLGEQGWEPDPLILDDQAIVLHLRGRGLVVLSGCGHAGIVNTVRYAKALTGVEAVHTVMGGFHLNGPLFEPRIPEVVAGLRELAPDVVVPAHCTGPRAHVAVANGLPDAWLPNAVGTRLELTGAPDTGAP